MTNHLRAQQLWDVVDPTGSTQETASEMARETRAAGKAAAIASGDDSLWAAKALDLIESHNVFYGVTAHHRNLAHP